MRLLKVILVGFWALVMMGTAVSTTLAHAGELLRSDPANGSILAQSPAEIRAWFGEEVQTDVSTLQVFSADGQRVDNGDGGVDLNDAAHASLVVTVPALPEGEYLVRWYVVLLDGDASESSFNFFVGDEAAAAAANFTPAAGEVLYYQAEEDDSSGSMLVWLVGGGLLGVGLLAVAALTLRRK